MKKKLIEVALPLEAINKESAREKSIRHGHYVVCVTEDPLSCDWVQVAPVCLKPESLWFEGNRPAAAKGIVNRRRDLCIGGL